jgi:hypothetical protein
LPIGRWGQTRELHGIRYNTTAKILGIYIGTTIASTIELTWKDKTHKIQGSIKHSTTSKLDLQQRIRVSTIWFLAKIWDAAQIIPIPDKYSQQIISYIIAYLWAGWIFRVPLSTLCRSTWDGGLGMINIKAKCQTLYLMRMQQLHRDQDSITARWLTQHHRFIQHNNPPNWIRLPTALEYLRLYIQETAYVGAQGDRETDSQHKKRIYAVLTYAQSTKNTTSYIRVLTKFPQYNWAQIWQNINKRFLPQRIRTLWYIIVHDIVPTNSRLNTIKLHDTGHCQHCGQSDTIYHRFTSCTYTQAIWEWTRLRIACFLRTAPAEIRDTWITFPDFKLYPPQRHNAVVSMIGHMLGYEYDNFLLTQHDYVDFLRRARKKTYQQHQRPTSCGKYLDVIDY